jgi:integrase
MLEQNDHELGYLYWKRLLNKITGNRPITQDKIPTNPQLKQLLMCMPIPGRALYSTLATSGMRIGEALSLKDGDMDLKSNPVRISIPAKITKTKEARITFITEEAKSFVEEWLKIRKDNSRLFSFSDSVAQTYWFVACEQCKMTQRDSSTNRLIYHPHSLRKYFRTVGGKINRDATEVLMGHKGNQNDPNYRRLEEDDLIKFYKQFEPTITLFSDAEEVKKQVKESLEEYELRFKNLEQLVGELLGTINKMQGKQTA